MLKAFLPCFYFYFESHQWNTVQLLQRDQAQGACQVWRPDLLQDPCSGLLRAREGDRGRRK
jgi:hypothetical protein